MSSAWRTSTLAIIGGVALAGSLFAFVWQAPTRLLTSRAAHYRQHHDSDSLWVVLKTINNGAPVEHVKQLLGNATRNNDPKYRAICARVMASHPEEAPDGLLDTDELLAYPANATTIFLQFRNGYLINFNPNDYPIKVTALQ